MKFTKTKNVQKTQKSPEITNIYLRGKYLQKEAILCNLTKTCKHMKSHETKNVTICMHTKKHKKWPKSQKITIFVTKHVFACTLCTIHKMSHFTLCTNLQVFVTWHFWSKKQFSCAQFTIHNSQFTLCTIFTLCTQIFTPIITINTPNKAI